MQNRCRQYTWYYIVYVLNYFNIKKIYIMLILLHIYKIWSSLIDGELMLLRIVLIKRKKIVYVFNELLHIIIPNTHLFSK